MSQSSPKTKTATDLIKSVGTAAITAFLVVMVVAPKPPEGPKEISLTDKGSEFPVPGTALPAKEQPLTPVPGVDKQAILTEPSIVNLLRKVGRESSSSYRIGLAKLNKYDGPNDSASRNQFLLKVVRTMLREGAHPYPPYSKEQLMSFKAEDERVRTNWGPKPGEFPVYKKPTVRKVTSKPSPKTKTKPKPKKRWCPGGK